MKGQTIGENIRQCRKDKNLSQEELAHMIGVTNITISRYENDIQPPKGYHLRLLANALGCETGHLLGEFDEKTRENADIAAKIPFTEESIELLKESKIKCDHGDIDSVMINGFIDRLVWCLLTDEKLFANGKVVYEYGKGGKLLELFHRLIETQTVIEKYSKEAFYDDDQNVLFYPDRKVLTAPDQLRMAKWEHDYILDQVGKIFSDLANVYIGTYVTVEEVLNETEEDHEV